MPRSALALLFLLAPLSNSFAGEPLIASGDRVAWIGGTLVESLQDRGDAEVAVVLSEPELRVPFRNLGWSGDDVNGSARRVFGSPSDGYARLKHDLRLAAPTVALLGYGFAEASNGPRGVAQFDGDLRRLVDDLRSENIRPILLQPFALPGIRTSGYPAAIQECRSIIAELAAADQLVVIDPAAAMERIGAEAFDAAGLRLSPRGKQAYGQAVAAALLGTDPQTLASELEPQRVETFSDLVAQKNALFFHRHRPMNETYLFLFRKHEQGNNAVEVDAFEPLVEQAEQAIWERAAQ